MAYRRTPRTQCPKGHPYSPENTTTNAEGTRTCRACARERHAAYEARKRNTTPPERTPRVEHRPTPQVARFRCEYPQCQRAHTVPDAHQHSDATLVVLVLKDGWALTPKVLCPIHAATAEAYSRPAPRRGRRVPNPNPA